jgi:superfamily II DNA or RNA helicase
MSAAPPFVPVPPQCAVASILAARYPPDRREDCRRVGGCSLAPHQAVGAERLARAIRRWNVAVLADDVGMGKTWTALAVVAALGGAGAATFVVPAALRAHWAVRLRQAFPDDHAAARLVTHGQLSRSATLQPVDRLAVIDEAHAFRNPNTQRYRALAAACAASPLLIVTATPVVNTLLDLYFQLRLRLGDGALRDLGVADLRALFQHAAERPADPPAAFRRLIRELVTARGRGIFDAAERRRLGFPRLLPARKLQARVADAPALGETLAAIRSLALPWFGPLPLRDGRAAPGGSAASAGAGALIRLMLLRRLDSGNAAFAASVDRLAAFNARAAAALRGGTLLAPAAAHAGAPAQLELDALIGVPVPRRLDAERLIRAADSDGRILRAMREQALANRVDAKLERLCALLRSDRARKTIVFTCYRDTAVAVWRALRDGERTALLHGSGGALGRESAGRAAVVHAFAPRSNGVAPPPAALEVRVLVATDAVSEGLNLQDAACVVSYDLPWNPVRLRQRVGRVDRLGCLHETVESFIFMPDARLDAMLRMLARLERKRREAGAVRTATRARPGHRGARAPAGHRLAGWLDAEEELRTLHRRLDGHPVGARGGSSIPVASIRSDVLAACVGRRASGDPDGPNRGPLLIVATGTGEAQQFSQLAHANGRWRPLDDAAAAAVLSRIASHAARADSCESEARVPVDIPEWVHTAIARLAREAAQAHRDLAAAGGGEPRRRDRTETRVARQLRAVALRAGDAGTTARVAQLLRRLAHGLNAGETARMRELLRRRQDGANLLARTEGALEPARSRPDAAARDIAADAERHAGETRRAENVIAVLVRADPLVKPSPPTPATG